LAEVTDAFPRLGSWNEEDGPLALNTRMFRTKELGKKFTAIFKDCNF
jgi:hypothetical protein